jgi:AcrR family transcriptional regulator
VRKTPTETRDAIRHAALAEFCAHGYHATTLQAIAAEVGLSRGAVLHHFSSKAALLNSVVEPLLSALQQLVASTTIGDPPNASEQEIMLDRLAALVLRHRHAVELLMHDIASCDQLDATQAWAGPLQQITVLLAGSRADETERIRAIAALGAILHPAATARLEMTSTGARRVLMHAGFAAISPERAHAPATTGRS